MVETEIQKFRREFFESLSEEGYRVYRKFENDYLMKKHPEQVTHRIVNCFVIDEWEEREMINLFWEKLSRREVGLYLKKYFEKEEKKEEEKKEEEKKEEEKKKNFSFLKKFFKKKEREKKCEEQKEEISWLKSYKK